MGRTLRNLGLGIALSLSALAHDAEGQKPKRRACNQQYPAVSKPANLENTIQAYVGCERARGTLRTDDRTSWIVSDATNGQRLADINPDIPRQSASMIKPWIALAYFTAVDERKTTKTKNDQRQLERMLRSSSNPATDYFIKKLGGPKAVQKIISTHYGRLGENVKVVEYIGNGRTYRNKASAADYSRLLYAIERQRVPHAKDLEHLMGLNNGSHTRLYPEDFKKEGLDIYNKTGTTDKLVGDIAVIEDEVIVVGIVENERGGLMQRRGTVKKVMQHVANLSWQAYTKRKAYQGR